MSQMLVNLSAMRLQLQDVLGYLLFTMCVLQLGVIDCCVLEHVVFFRKASG